MSQFKASRPRLVQVILRWMIWQGLRFLIFLTGLVPYGFSYRLGGFLGGLAYYLLKRPVRLADVNLKKAFGNIFNGVDREKIIKASLENIAINILEWLSFGKLKGNYEKFFVLEGEENLSAAVRSGRGVVIISGHIGNWETGAALIAGHGHDLAVVAAPIYDERIDNLVVKMRSSYGIKTITRGSVRAQRQLLGAIKNKEILVGLIDQDVKQKAQGCFVDFFGDDAYTPTGMIRLGLKKKMIFLPIYSIKEKNGKNRVVIEPFYDPETSGNMDSDVEKITRYLTKRLENAIRNNPEQWVWMHKRWQTKRNDVS